MSIEEKEEAIGMFKSSLYLMNIDFGVKMEDIRKVRLRLCELVGYFPSLKETEEYREIENIFDALKSKIRRTLFGKSLVEDLIKYGGELIAKATEELARIKATQKPIEVKKEIVPVPIPASPWYKVASVADELSDAMWEDDYKIRNVLPVFEKLINELQNLGDSENFCKELRKFYEELNKGEIGGLTIPELKKLNPSYVPKDEELRTIITRIKKYARRKAEE
jgi:hypothetical protein